MDGVWREGALWMVCGGRVCMGGCRGGCAWVCVEEGVLWMVCGGMVSMGGCRGGCAWVCVDGVWREGVYGRV